MSTPQVNAFFDEATFTVSYVVFDPGSRRAAVIDPVLDFDPASGRTQTDSVEEIVRFIGDNELTLDWILETHVHADHLSGAPHVREALGGSVAIGEQVAAVQSSFKEIFNMDGLATDGSQFDRLFADGDTFKLGEIECRVLSTPGHTPACVTYVIGEAAFVGDTLFMPDFGTARTDFPGGSAGQLYDSIHRVLSLPGSTRIFTCHDYKAPGRDVYAWETTVQEQRAANVHIKEGVSRDAFVELRERRDAKLTMPRLILPSIQVNVRAGALPDAESNGISYLKLPIDAL
jgi:glyoxylase-like metal-dependent hydrolase (beta-lactamase superfamily II)